MLGRICIGWIGFGLAIAAVCFAPPVAAQSLESLLPDLIKDHDRIIARQADVRAAKNRAQEALGDWYPILEPTLNHGFEFIQNPHDANTSLPQSEFDLTLTQLLWDFGATNAAVEKARLQLGEARIRHSDAMHDLLQEAVEAYVNLVRAHRTVEFSRQSKGNIQRQSGLEEARVETGSGLSTDVLQAKAQLAGAEARVIQGDGALISAKNRYVAVFNSKPDLERLVPVKLPVELLPNTLDEAIGLAKKNNADLILDRLAEAIARRDVHNTYGTEFFPKIEGSLERKWKNNVSGTADLKKEFLAKVELSMSFNLGLTQINTLRAAQSDVVSKSRTVADTERRIVEEVRNAWQELHTARATASSLLNQADITAGFLELAREERKLGQRTLIDVLSNETNLINAQSDAESAQADVLIAAYKLLNVTGALSLGTFKTARRAPLPRGAAPKAPVAPTQPDGPTPSPYSTERPVDRDGYPLRDDASPLASPAPEPGEVPDGTLTKEAIRPFDQFFGEVRSIFKDEFRRNNSSPPGKSKTRQ